MAQTIYLVTTGEYSDYGVEAAFSTEELAQDYMNTFPFRHSYGGYNGISTMELDAIEGMQEVKAARAKGHRCFDVFISANDKMDVKPAYDDQASTRHRYNGVVRGIVWAKDEQHAAKIMTDYKMKGIALNVPEDVI